MLSVAVRIVGNLHRVRLDEAVLALQLVRLNEMR